MKKSTEKKKGTVKSYKKRKKSGNTLRAFQLVVFITALSVGISLAIIFIHSNWNKLSKDTVEDKELTSEKSIESDSSKQPKVPESKTPDISISVQPPSGQSTLPAVNSTASSTQTQTTISTAVTPGSIENLGMLVFVIDDAGNNLRELEPFLRISSPLTIAVLPGLPYSAEAAKRIRAAGKEVILHQPMEAVGAQNPGPGAIYSWMSADEIRAVLSRNIAEIGPVAGINNHQGSKITMDIEAMETILAFCREHGLYFLDSRTTAETAAPAAARKLGIKIAERDVFIDNEQNRDSMLGYISGGLLRAQKNGSAVMIGHTWSPELAPLLTEQFSILINKGYTLKTASAIIK